MSKLITVTVNLSSCRRINQQQFDNPFCFGEEAISRFSEYALFLSATMISALFIRGYCCEATNIVKDMTSVGFSHLQEFKWKGKISKDDVREMIRRRMDPRNIPPLYPNGWIPILESRDLQVGETKSVTALGKEFAVFRGENRKAFVLDAFCPHLGANLAVGGQVVNNCLKCPFHGWQFNGEDGKCTAIPYSERAIPKVAKTKSWVTCEVNGTIFIWHHAEGYPPSWEMPMIPELEENRWSYRGRSEHIVNCHIQEIPENGADLAHLDQLHSASVFTDDEIQVPYVFSWAEKLTHIFKLTWQPSEEENNSHVAELVLSQHFQLNKRTFPFSTIRMEIRQIGPATVHLQLTSTFGRGVFLQHITPQGPLQQRVVHQLYTTTLFPPWISNNLMKAEAVMFERDVMIWNNKKFIKNPILVKEDKLIGKYRRWYSQFYSEHSPTLRGLMLRTLDW